MLLIRRGLDARLIEVWILGFRIYLSLGLNRLGSS